MTLSLIEGAIAALSAYIQANIAGKLDVLDAEYGDFALDDIKVWYEGNVPSALPEYPSVCFRGKSYQTEEQTSSKIYLKNYIDIIIYVGNDDDQVRFKQLCRYARAIISLLIEGEGSYGYNYEHQGPVDISDTLQAGAFLQAIILPISLYPLDGEAY